VCGGGGVTITVPFFHFFEMVTLAYTLRDDVCDHCGLKVEVPISVNRFYSVHLDILTIN